MNDHRTIRVWRLVMAMAAALALGFALVWSFLAYRDPDMVLSFAALLQACGIALSR